MRDEASATAMLVARGVAFRSLDPRYGHLVPETMGRLARAFVEHAGWRIPRAGVVRVAERLTVPGLSLHYILRKRYIEELLRTAIDDGFKKLIVMGAGLDTVAIRLANEFPELQAVEVDHPRTQALKRELLKASGVTTRVAFEALDLRESGRRRDGGAPLRTVYLAEAVFLYLSEDEVRKTLRSIRAANTRIIFTFFEPRRGAINFQNATFIANSWLRWRGEPARWAISPDGLAQFLASEGFALRELARDETFQRRYVQDDVPLARGEHIAVADA